MENKITAELQDAINQRFSEMKSAEDHRIEMQNQRDKRPQWIRKVSLDLEELRIAKRDADDIDLGFY